VRFYARNGIDELLIADVQKSDGLAGALSQSAGKRASSQGG
jgi:hypothetical protein